MGGAVEIRSLVERQARAPPALLAPLTGSGRLAPSGQVVPGGEGGGSVLAATPDDNGGES